MLDQPQEESAAAKHDNDSAASASKEDKKTKKVKGKDKGKEGGDLRDADSKTDGKKKKKKKKPTESGAITNESVAERDMSAQTTNLKRTENADSGLAGEEATPSRPVKPSDYADQDVQKYLRFALCGNDDVHLYDPNLILLREFRLKGKK